MSDEVDEATLTERLLAEIDAEDGIVLAPPMIGAWSITPPAPSGVDRRAGVAPVSGS